MKPDLVLGVGGSRFVECPICQSSVPYFDLNTHMDSSKCVPVDDTAVAASAATDSATKRRKSVATDVQQQSQSTTASSRKLPTADEVSQMLSQQSAVNGSSIDKCPACGVSVVMANINHHLDIECSAARQQKGSKRQPPSQSQPMPSAPAVPQSAQTIPAATAIAAPVAAPVAARSSAARPPAPETAAAAIDLCSASLESDAADVLLVSATTPALLLDSSNSLSLNASSSLPATNSHSNSLIIPPTPSSNSQSQNQILSLPDATVAPMEEMKSGDHNAENTTPPQPLPLPPSSSQSSTAAAAGAAHPFFTSGPRSAAAFKPQRRSKHDGVRCQAVVHFTAAMSSDATAQSVACGLVCELQDGPVPGTAAAATQGSSSSSSSSTFTPTSVCSSADLSVFHISAKFHEPAADLWTECHVRCARNVLPSPGSPGVDFSSPSLACNQRRPGQKRFNFSPSLLKSLLQKNVRLSRPAAATRVALQLMVCHGVSEFLRRFVIILFEDAVLHPSLPQLTWLTLASSRKDSEMALSAAHVDFLLQMVHQVASVGVKDPLTKEEFGGDEHDLPSADDGPAEEQRQAAAPTLASPLEELTDEQRMLVKCILLRACAGGGQWDVRMLRAYALLWTRRFTAENRHRAAKEAAAAKGVALGPLSPATGGLISPPGAAGGSWLGLLRALYNPSRSSSSSSAVLPAASLCLSGPITLATVGYVAEEDLVLSAVDQHCSPIVERLLSEGSRTRAAVEAHCPSAAATGSGGRTTHPAVPSGAQCEECKELLGKTLWRCRGSVTNKHPLRPASAAEIKAREPDAVSARLFQQIKHDVDAAAKRILISKLVQ
jgi:hypothetical protein